MSATAPAAVRERGMIFTGETIPALLNLAVGENVKPLDPAQPCKWVTRRLMKPQPDLDRWPPLPKDIMRWSLLLAGDILWIRETHHIHECDCQQAGALLQTSRCKLCHGLGSLIEYKATMLPDVPRSYRWRPSIFLPKDFARSARFRIVQITPSRLQDISERDSIAEGFERREHFIRKWDQLHKPPMDFSRDPWVWRIELRRIAL